MTENNGISDEVPLENKEKLSESQANTKKYDLSQLLMVSRGDMSFVRSIVKMFIVKTPLYIDRITKEFESGNFHEMGEVAHQLKQSIYAMGINTLRIPVMAIILVGRNNNPDDDLILHIANLNHFAQLVIQDLKTDFEL